MVGSVVGPAFGSMTTSLLGDTAFANILGGAMGNIATGFTMSKMFGYEYSDTNFAIDAVTGGMGGYYGYKNSQKLSVKNQQALTVQEKYEVDITIQQDLGDGMTYKQHYKTDLTPTIERIEKGIPYSHRNDGII